MKRPLIKYCGNKSFDDWCYVVESEADFVGVIFAPSKRRVTPQQVKNWLEDRPLPNEKKIVGVFVHSNIDEILDVIKNISISIIQCHGQESPQEILQIKEKTGLPVWKAIHHDAGANEKMAAYAGIADGYIVDTKSQNAWGGTGIPFNWTAIPVYLEESKKQGVPCFIAGGVTPVNVGQLVRFAPDGIDLASGIEASEKKCPDLIRKFENEVNQHVNNVS